MPEINDAPNVITNVRIDNVRQGKPSNQIPAQTNCALCTCAAIVTHGRGQVMTTTQIAKIVPLMERAKKKLPQEFVNDADKLAGAVQHSQFFGRQGWTGTAKNGEGNLAHLDDTTNTQIIGLTHFVKRELGLTQAWTIGDTKEDPKTLDACTAYMQSMGDQGCVFAVLSKSDGHWNFAHKVGDKVQYVDYQMNHADLGNGKPVSGDAFQKGMGGGNASGGDLGIVIAFQVKDHFAEGTAT